MEKDFKLETILTVTTGINLTDDFNDVFEMANFVYNTNFVGTINLQGMRSHMRGHIFSIYPEFKNIRLNFSTNDMDKWIAIQKEKYGDMLPISRYGQKLNKGKYLAKKNTN